MQGTPRCPRSLMATHKIHCWALGIHALLSLLVEEQRADVVRGRGCGCSHEDVLCGEMLHTRGGVLGWGGMLQHVLLDHPFDHRRGGMASRRVLTQLLLLRVGPTGDTARARLGTGDSLYSHREQ